MKSKKQQLSIPPLKTIDEILLELNFLKYSTQKRNLAYQLQYFDFKIKLFNHYRISWSVRKSYLRQVVIIITNIIEYLLFISLRKIYGNNPKKHRLYHLISKSKKEGLIDKALAKKLNKIRDLRNNLHPSKQSFELDIQCFNRKEVNYYISVVKELISKLAAYFTVEEVDSECYPCSHEEFHSLYFAESGMCPYCGEYAY